MEVRKLASVVAAAQLSQTHTCRCLLFTSERGGTCGMPAALAPRPIPPSFDVGGSGGGGITTLTKKKTKSPLNGSEEWVPSPLCWSCKYMEAVSGMEADLEKSDNDEDDNEDDNEDDEEYDTGGGGEDFLFQDALGPDYHHRDGEREAADGKEDTVDAAEPRMAETSVAVATAASLPAAATSEEGGGGGRWGWLGSIGGALLGGGGADQQQQQQQQSKRWQQLELEYQQLTRLKAQSGEGGLPLPARRRRAELKRLLGKTKAQRRSSSSSATAATSACGGGGNGESGATGTAVAAPKRAPAAAALSAEGNNVAAKAMRLRQLLKAARVSETHLCTETLFSASLGEACGRPAALVPAPMVVTGDDDDGGLAVKKGDKAVQEFVPSRLCWQCKRIEVN
jgi:hypothetical protein